MMSKNDECKKVSLTMSGASILVVEDNPVNLKLATLLLKKAGYSVHAANDAETAQQLLKSLHPALIILDIQLPGMDGLTLASQLKADPHTSDIPIIALTAYAMKGDEQQMFDAGCNGYIPKPIDTRTFITSIAQYLTDEEQEQAPPL